MPTSASTGTGQLSTSGGSGSGDEYDQMDGEQLRAELADRELPVSGTNDEKRARLRDADASSDDAEATIAESGGHDPEGEHVRTPEEQRDVAIALNEGPERTEGFKAAVEQQRADIADEFDGTQSLHNTEVIEDRPAERNTPDGAPVVTREEDVVPGVRVDLPPSAPADPRSLIDPASAGGVMEVTRPDGSRVVLDTSQPDFAERAEAIRKGERHV